MNFDPDSYRENNEGNEILIVKNSFLLREIKLQHS